MKSEIILWNLVPLKCKALPDLVLPFSPVHKHLKFSAVLGALSAYNSIVIRPNACPLMEISKNTRGFLFTSFCFSTFSGLRAFRVCSIFSSFDYFWDYSYSFFATSYFWIGFTSCFISSSSFCFCFFCFIGAAYSYWITF